MILSRQLDLPAQRDSATRARRWLRDLLDEAGRTRWIDDAELALSEVVTNALLHAHTPVQVAVQVSDAAIRVEVVDHSPTLPVRREHASEATTGRGLELVAAVTSAHGVDPIDGNGKAVWFVVGDAVASDVTSGTSEDPFRDAEERQAPATGRGVEVVLLDLPVALWTAAGDHHEALVRELCFHLADNPGPHLDVAAADRARALVALAFDPNRSFTGAGAVDLSLTLPPEGDALFDALSAVLDEAERLAVEGQLLARPGLPEVVAVREWVIAEVRSQASGGLAAPWSGADNVRYETAVRPTVADASLWGPDEIRTSDRMVIAVDEANRIAAVSPSLAALLEWDPRALEGRRLVTIVPPSWREAHVAGFTRHLSTGETKVLGTPVELPALTSSGNEVLCTVLIQRAPRGLRDLFVAWFEPVEAPSADEA